MEGTRFTFSKFRLHSSFRLFDGTSAGARSVWHVYLILLLAGMVGVGVFAYLTYLWAITDDSFVPPSSPSRDTQTIADLRSVVELYEERAREHAELRAKAPVAPLYLQGTGASVLPVSAGETPLPVDVPLIETATGTGTTTAVE